MEIIIKINIDEVAEETTKETNELRAYSKYARFFDESCPNWDKSSECNLGFLRAMQYNANARLKSQGYLFLNDVYDMLGLPRTEEGAIVGWVYDPKNEFGDNYVDFGLDDVRSRHFVNGYERIILLDFNVDGAIFDKN